MALIKILKEFLTYILRSILFSAVIGIISLSFFTKQFPPDLKKIKTFYANYQQLKDISSAMAARSVSIDSDDKDIEKIIDERKQLSEILTKLNFTESSKPGAQTSESISCVRQIATIAQLKEKIRQLDEINFDLNKQVVQLKLK